MQTLTVKMVVSSPEFAWLRIAGKVEFTDSLDLKQKSNRFQ